MGNLTLNQYKSLLTEMYKVENQQYKTLLILLRASTAESATFNEILDSFGD